MDKACHVYVGRGLGLLRNTELKTVPSLPVPESKEYFDGITSTRHVHELYSFGPRSHFSWLDFSFDGHIDATVGM